MTTQETTGTPANGKATQAITKDTEGLYWADPDAVTIVEDDPTHPLHDPDRVKAPVKELAASIKARGVKVPCLFRQNGKTLEVVNGRRRVRATRLANEALAKEGAPIKLRVPFTLDKGDDTTLLEDLIVTNEHDHKDGPLAKARKMARLLERGRTPQDCAIVFGVTKVTIANWTALLACCSQVQKAIEAGTLSVEAAKELSGLEPADQVEALKKMQAAGATKGLKGKAAAKAAKKGKDPEASKARALPKAALRRMVAILEPTEEEQELTEEEQFALTLFRFVLGEGRLTGHPELSKVLRKALKGKARKAAGD